ncbi:hypothetical protein KC727_01650 [Candidatus Kaiserbacteria bacterium]|nr:hypothetical protein [Candidatus Kaiserbacteria bacterium]
MIEQGQHTLLLGAVGTAERPIPFGVTERDRAQHVIIFGEDDTDTVAYVRHLFLQDVELGTRTILIDKKGNIADAVRKESSHTRRDAITLIAPPSDARMLSSALPDLEHAGSVCVIDLSGVTDSGAVSELVECVMQKVDASNTSDSVPLSLYLCGFSWGDETVLTNLFTQTCERNVSLTIQSRTLATLGHISPKILFEQVGTVVAFRVATSDADVLEDIFQPKCFASDLACLEPGHFYITLMVRGVRSEPFRAWTHFPTQPRETRRVAPRAEQSIVESSSAKEQEVTFSVAVEEIVDDLSLASASERPQTPLLTPQALTRMMRLKIDDVPRLR